MSKPKQRFPKLILVGLLFIVNVRSSRLRHQRILRQSQFCHFLRRSHFSFRPTYVVGAVLAWP
jgi:hypothetical protein